MAKFIVLALCAVVAGVFGEPPSSYLPPQARDSPSASYGAPNGAPNGFRSNGKASSFHSQRTGAQSFSYNSLHENQFGGSQARKSFGSGKFNGGAAFGGLGAPSRQYGAPGQFGAPAQNGGAFAGRGGSGFGPSRRYGAPSLGGSPNGGFAPSQQYGAPSFGASADGFGASNGLGVSRQYGAPGFGAAGDGFGVSQQYGAPGFGSSGARASNHRFGSSAAKFGNGNGNGFSGPAPVYGAPSSRYGAPNSKMDDDLAEPANYEYTYEVQAAEESGAEFGHQESREEESARGVYHVLLPDGRTQIVEYEADEEGFRPVIRYEESGGYPAAGGPQGPY